MSEIANRNYTAGMKKQPIKVTGESGTHTVLGSWEIIPLGEWKRIHIFFSLYFLGQVQV
jgi:hypothetical protein